MEKRLEDLLEFVSIARREEVFPNSRRLLSLEIGRASEYFNYGEEIITDFSEETALFPVSRNAWKEYSEADWFSFPYNPNYLSDYTQHRPSGVWVPKFVAEREGLTGCSTELYEIWKRPPYGEIFLIAPSPESLELN